MGMLFSGLNINDSVVKNVLVGLDGHVILSRAEYPYRFNILDLHHKRHPAIIKRKDGSQVSHTKEWAFGHIMNINGEVFFSERPTANRDAEEHIISETIYSSMTSNGIFDIDRDAKKIDQSNVNSIVRYILSLQALGLIP